MTPTVFEILNRYVQDIQISFCFEIPRYSDQKCLSSFLLGGIKEYELFDGGGGSVEASPLLLIPELVILNLLGGDPISCSNSSASGIDEGFFSILLGDDIGMV